MARSKGAAGLPSAKPGGLRRRGTQALTQAPAIRDSVPLPVPDWRQARFGGQDGDQQPELVDRERWLQVGRQEEGALRLHVLLS